ncbi:hypothetical protein [Acidisphaera rubrifaciens]|uniref:Phage minor structual protein GP20 n=1 Tax=Acidisphaera rubrifaciens HS-AP3 TaxID=1231350 RepID=A0A0D6P3Y8_9PROT|nr:hypothetical protein [Acidisphaera rubrifaciens]GAN76367.1 hypothetical protein Asru_0086_43 [Acidisphaera rubrifaciens HS-AP3]
MPDPDAPTPEAIVAELRQRAETLEQQLASVQRDTETRIVQAELRAEALRAGIVDMDGLKLADASQARLNDRGEVEGAAQVVAQLRRNKPWLFTGASSSSAASVPPAQAPRQKRATEMDDSEWRAARSELLRRRF